MVRLSKKSAVLLASISGVVILDVANGLLGENVTLPGLPITPGELGRTVLYVVALLVLVKRRGSVFRTLQWAFAGLVLLGLLGPLRGATLGNGMSSLAADLVKLSKFLYGPALVIFFAAVCVRFHSHMRDVFVALTVLGVAVALALLLSRATGLGSATYGSRASAYKGLFLGQNAVGLLMGITLISATDLFVTRPRIRRFAPVALIATGMLVLGTRTATLGAILLPVAVLALHAWRARSWASLQKMAVIGLATLSVVVLVGGQAYRTIRSESFLASKYSALAGGQFTRLFLLGGAVAYTSHRGISGTLVGDGFMRYQRGVARTLSLPTEERAAEVDWMDLFGAHGLLFAVVLYAFYLWFLVAAVRMFHTTRSPHDGAVALMLVLYIAHATLAGHALGTPIPAGAIAPVLGHLWIADRYSRRAPAESAGTVPPSAGLAVPTGS